MLKLNENCILQDWQNFGKGGYNIYRMVHDPEKLIHPMRKYFVGLMVNDSTTYAIDPLKCSWVFSTHDGGNVFIREIHKLWFRIHGNLRFNWSDLPKAQQTIDKFLITSSRCMSFT